MDGNTLGAFAQLLSLGKKSLQDVLVDSSESLIKNTQESNKDDRVLKLVEALKELGDSGNSAAKAALEARLQKLS